MVRMEKLVVVALIRMSATGSDAGRFDTLLMYTQRQRGFTLVEILLVLVIIVVITAMVAPSFFQSLGGDVSSEARRLHMQLRMAADEAQLSGRPVRCSVWPDRMRFRVPGNGQWVAMSGVLSEYVMTPGFNIMNASRDGSDGMTGSLESIDQAWQEKRSQNNAQNSFDDTAASQKREEAEQPPLADFLFWPDGSVTQGVIEIASADATEIRRIHLQSGPGGIRLEKQEP